MYTYNTRLFICFAHFVFSLASELSSAVESHLNKRIGSEAGDQMRDKIIKMIHQNCRQGVYPRSSVNRFEVPEDKVPWFKEFPDYNPASYSAPTIQGQPWADPDISDPQFTPKWNDVDGNVSRKSHTGEYAINDKGFPLNPVGRTGIIGRGLLGRWGPNHAADPIVTRWKRNGTGAVEISRVTENPILQFIAVQRKDSGDWALPGGMVDPGEVITSTLRREFMEEAMNSLEKDEAQVEELKESLEEFFKKGDEVFKGYVDDPRNTDNAWIETVALNFHDENGSIVGKLELSAGDDAANVCWTDVNKELELYASHRDFIKRTAQMHNAHW
ncbi:ADP-ribose pyrophosphatase, mitochondrial [Neodiprion fabricii]|uniref:ADP-ribose pyrophosphatase, mitochondrial n=1 Tax=Neodiprion fabricii TaxID=2872261 RepID=UPI001ED9707A|nr:ADP-ribose pyrophosphatase, mitochondrial [Neodiprion fabricii]